MSELWQPVVGWEGLYEVSNQGRVRSLDRVCRNGKKRKGQLLAGCISQDGYYWTFGLCRNGKSKCRTAHSLVAEAFLGPRPEGCYILHGEKGSLNNTPENLRYGTPLENMRDKYKDGTVPYGTKHGNARLTEEKVLEARKRWREGEPQINIAREFNVAARTLHRAIHGMTWAHVRD